MVVVRRQGERRRYGRRVKRKVGNVVSGRMLELRLCILMFSEKNGEIERLRCLKELLNLEK